jgi:hypothetical protein
VHGAMCPAGVALSRQFATLGRKSSHWGSQRPTSRMPPCWSAHSRPRRTKRTLAPNGNAATEAPKAPKVAKAAPMMLTDTRNTIKVPDCCSASNGMPKGLDSARDGGSGHVVWVPCFVQTCCPERLSEMRSCFVLLLASPKVRFVTCDIETAVICRWSDWQTVLFVQWMGWE